MKKRITCIFAAIIMTLVLIAPVMADDFTGADNWTVTYTSDNKLVPTFTDKALDDPIAHMQPGDVVTFEIKLQNENKENADWWMNNMIIRSMEDDNTSAGGGYTYLLKYYPANPVSGDEDGRILYSSETVGGEDANSKGETGLHQATDALEDFFFLETLAKGQTAKVVLEVSLDGETQGNYYQDKSAELSMEFAVELNDQPVVTVTPIPSPNTGDTNSLLPYIICLAAGAAALVAAIILVRRRGRKEDES